MAVRSVELFLERSFSRGRKEISGKGAVNTKVRVVDDVIFVKMKMDFSGLEQRMFRFIASEKGEARYYQSVLEESTANAEKILFEICQLKIREVSFKIDLENGYSFAIIVLDDDIEKLIKEGKIATPTKQQVDTK